MDIDPAQQTALAERLAAFPGQPVTVAPRPLNTHGQGRHYGEIGGPGFRIQPSGWRVADCPGLPDGPKTA